MDSTTAEAQLSIIIINPGLDSRARTALEHTLESVVSAREKVVRSKYSCGFPPVWRAPRPI